ncbi:MAG: type I-E CRISPR-associated endonuclease Cas1 [Spirochaetia bacterium]|nr:type I-E CRISPR-associated endonuclease Cas1 [Spirochaetia bacterium]
MKNRLFVPVTKNLLPQVKERYPFLYLERGRLEIDDSSIKWIDSNKNIVRIPVASIMTILLGPGTSVTHEAIKICGNANCTICWVGTDSMLYYATGLSPTSDTRKIKKQASLSINNKSRLEIAKRMFSFRFPNDEISDKTLNELMGMEGKRVKALYEEYANKYQVGWKGRSYIPGKFQMSDITNKILTAANTALYAVILSCIFSLGYSPYFGFVHSGSPLPFVYDIADLYKEKLTIELSFQLTYKLAGDYDRELVASNFIDCIQNEKLFSKIAKDINFILEGKK